MPKVILLPLGGSQADQTVLATARAAGHAHDSHLVALHVPQGQSSRSATDTERLDLLDGREKAAMAAWKAFCVENNITITDEPGTAGMTSEWLRETGSETDWLVHHGRSAGLIVMGRDPDRGQSGMARIETALMETGQPIMIAPRQGLTESLTGVVGIAWKDTREAAGAVRAALPFIKAARLVVIFTVLEKTHAVDHSHQRIARMLRWHNPHIRVQPLLEHSRPPIEVLMDAAHQSLCGLMVMGGYGHSKLREAVMGGFTRSVLDDAPLPVLMAH